TVLKPRRLRWEEEERRRHEAETRWYEEQKRLRLLDENLKAWRSNQDLRMFLEAMETEIRARGSSKEGSEHVDACLRWERELADRSDPLPGYLSRLAKDPDENET